MPYKRKLTATHPTYIYWPEKQRQLACFVGNQKIDDDRVCIKGALTNIATDEIALISSINNVIQNDYKYRMISSYDNEYKICQCKMIAPLLFWDELKNRLIN